MSVPTRRILDPIFGSPILRAANNGTATWTKVNTSSQWQKGTGWQASLYGGVQTGDDWGAAFIPTLELHVTDFNSGTWSYYMTGTQTMGVNLVLWEHNPSNYNQRVEITQLGNVAGLGKTAGWNSHTLSKTTDQFMWYGEDWSTGSAVALTGSGLTSGTLYGWDDFQADVLFKNWTIYRVSLEYGWEASGTFDYVWVVEAKFNGQPVLFIPSPSEAITATTALTTVTETSASAIKTAVETLDNIVSGNEAQVDIVAALPAGTNLLGKVGIDQATANANEVVLKAGTAAVGKVGHDKTGIGHGVKTVSTVGADEVLAASTAAKVIIIQAQTDNTGVIAVGATGVDATVATGNGVLLYAGDSITLEIDNLNDIYIDATVAGDGVRYLYET